MTEALLSVKDLTMSYRTRQGEVRAVDGVSFELGRGQSLGIVGESGSGKTSVAMSLMKLLPDNARLAGGSIVLDGVDLVPLSEKQMQGYRWSKVSMIFQAAMNSLDPVYRVGDQIMEAIEYHTHVSHAEARMRVAELFDLVGLDHAFARRYPHELSGGMRQRAVIAMALSCGPELVIADEPTTALDVIVQDRILGKLREIQPLLNMSMIYISHDMAVIAEMCDLMAVMYAGRIVELGETAEVFKNPIHPYTKSLISAFPSVTGEKRRLEVLHGEPPSMIAPPEGCRFHPRCPNATEVCQRKTPPVIKKGAHQADCWNPLWIEPPVAPIPQRATEDAAVMDE